MHQILGTRFEAQNRQLPWQSLAHPLPEGQPIHGAVEALHYAELAEPVFKEPIYAGFGYNQVLVPDKWAVCRYTDNMIWPGDGSLGMAHEKQVLGIVGPNYTILQNLDLATALDNSGISNQYPVHSVGTMKAGALVFICLSMGAAEIAQEEYHNYLLVITGHDGATATSIAYTPVRIDCTNALLRGVASATAVLTLSHGRHINRLLAAATKQSIPETAQTLQYTMAGKLQQMAKTRLTGEQVQDILAKVVTGPRKPAAYKYMSGLDRDVQEQHAQALQKGYENGVARTYALRDKALTLYNRYNESGSRNRGTAYALYQALTELALHREGPSAEGKEDKIAVSNLLGSRAAEMGRAFTILEQVAA